MDSYERAPLHGTTRWEYDELYVGIKGHTCRYCDTLVRGESVVCAAHKGYYIKLRRKVRLQVARLIELARDRRG